jgi:hypothetical protein
MGYYIYGDAAYPLRSWLMVGFRNPQNEDQERFNMHGSKARVIIECAFGKLKGQWRCLHNGLKTRDTQLWKSIIVCCCTLHNVTIEISGAGWDWDAGVVRGDRDPSDPHTYAEDPDGSVTENPWGRVRDHQSAQPKREKL